MKAARILVLGIALAAGGAAAYLVSGDEPKPEPAPAPVVQQFPTVDVLIAKADIGMGTAVTAQSRQQGTLSLALRSLLDASKTEEARTDDRGGGVNTVRFGVTTTR